MSEQKFKDAKGNLAFSQQLRDSIMASQMPQQSETQPLQVSQPQTEAQQPTELPQEVEQEKNGFLQAVKDTITPFMEKITQMLSKKEDEPQEVTVKMDGKMTPENE